MKACPGLRSGIASRLVTPAAKLVIPAKAGIQRRGVAANFIDPYHHIRRRVDTLCANRYLVRQKVASSGTRIPIAVCR